MNIIQQLFALPVLETLSPGITRRKMDELDILVIQTLYCDAAVALQGAHLLAWRPLRQTNSVLWLSDNTPFKAGIPLRGGVPVCWPWFTDLGGEPFHGFARIMPWQLTALDNARTALSLTLRLCDTPQTRQWWNHAFQLELTLNFTAEICELLLTAHGNYSTTAALHSYLATSDIRTTRIHGVGTQGYDTIAGKPRQNLPSPLSLKGEFGAICSDAEPQTVLITPDRTLTLTHVNNSNVVVWNPWQQRAAQTSDIPNDGWQHFVCLETAAIDRPLVSTPRHPASLGVQFALSHH
ncbi:TPA: D-hexose-6-phosphate mutarotase [Klebsiella quasipneumoniae subsp. similipneumoniae]|nr:D-hexose-6-phosphate mutarotase [Klebsiella quasipneumoniae subsp. similipneumoniae]